jgi:hypothetical protein
MATLKVPVAQARTILAVQSERGEELLEAAKVRYDESLYAEWDGERKRWADETMQGLRDIYEGDAEAEEFRSTVYPIPYFESHPWAERLAPDLTSIESAVGTLRTLFVRLQQSTGPGTVDETMMDMVQGVDPDRPIFVHGHDAEIRHQVVRVLEKSTGRDAIVLHEQPSGGRTILEKFEQHAEVAAYAVVLLTADDEGGPLAKPDERRPRGRQNVVFELGFFFGELGRDRVAVLLDPNVEKPSDIDGLMYIPIDPNGAWTQALAKELTGAGIKVDYARIP